MCRCLREDAGPSGADALGIDLANPARDWLQFVSIANAEFMGPALAAAVLSKDLAEKLPDDLRRYLSLLLESNAARNARIRAQCESIGVLLARNDMEAVLLKGAAWLFDGSVAPASDRMISDIDLLMRPDHVEGAAQLLAASGYLDTTGRFAETAHFHEAPLLPRAGEAAVEIHRDLAHRRNLLPAEVVLASARPVAPGLSLAAAKHRIAHNVIHAQVENGDWIGGVARLLNMLDLARLVTRHNSEIDWHRFADKARASGLVAPLSGALRVAHELFGSPLPAPLAVGGAGRFDAARCRVQRRWRFLGTALEPVGRLHRALAWERDAYGLSPTEAQGLRGYWRVSALRLQRIRRRLASAGSAPVGPPPKP